MVSIEAYQLQSMLEGSQAQDPVGLSLERSKIGQPRSPHKVDVVKVRTSQACDLNQSGSVLFLCSVLDKDILNSLVVGVFFFVIDVDLGNRQGFTVTHTIERLEWSGVLSLWHEEYAASECCSSDAGILGDPVLGPRPRGQKEVLTM